MAKCYQLILLPFKGLKHTAVYVTDVFVDDKVKLYRVQFITPVHSACH